MKVFNIFKKEIDWNTTAHKGAIAREINNILTSKLREICKVVLTTVPNVASIYLTDSYSCGEASVIVDGDKMQFMSDLDLVVVSKGIPQLYLLRFLTKLTRKFTSNNPSVDIKLINELLLRKYPFLFFKLQLEKPLVIYGNDVLHCCVEGYVFNNLQKTQLYTYLLRDALFYYFDRLFESLIPCSMKLSSRKNIESLDRLQKSKLLYSAAKLLIACHKILLLTDKEAFASARTKRERLQYIKLHWSKKFKSISHELPLFINLSEELLNYYLKPQVRLEEYAYDKWIEVIQASSTLLKLLFRLNSTNSLNRFIKYIYTSKCNLISSISKIYSEKSIPYISSRRALTALLMLGFSIRRETVNEYWLNEALKEVGLYKCLVQSNTLLKLRILNEVIAENYISASAFCYLPFRSYLIR